MVKVLLICLDLLLYGIDFAVLLKFMDIQYGKNSLTLKTRVLLLLSVAAISGVILWVSPFAGTYPFFSVLFSLFFLRFYQKDWQKMILLSSIEFVTALYLTVFLLAVIRSAKLDFSYLGLNFFLLSGSMHVCFWSLILILGKIRMEESVLLPPKHFAVIMAIPGISFLVLVFFLLRINSYPDTLFYLVFPLITAFIFINVTTAFIYSQFCNLLQRNTDILLLQQQIKLSEQYYEDLSLSQQRLKGIRHDMKNHLQSLSWIAARITPASRETEELQEYLGQLTQDIEEASQILSTGNMGMDAILSLKIGQAKEQKITVHSKISVPKEMGLATEDSIIILGNLLDNAIKACRENPEEKRWICLDIHYIPRSLFIRVTNPLPLLPETSEGHEKNSGFGLKNVRTAVKNYHGVLEIQEEKECFTVKILLYNL